MKNMKRLFALLVAIMILVAGVAAFADDGETGSGETPSTPAAHTITINRDSSWQASSTEDRKATYTWYRIFDAAITDADTVVYTISGTNASDKVAALPNIFTSKLASDGSYYITLTDSTTSAADIVTALETMLANTTTAALFTSDSVTSEDNPVVLDVGSDGYYYIKASNGKDAAVQTIGSVEIQEKNDYPTIDKKQKKHADSSYGDAVIPAEIGKVIDYQITVHIPTDAVGPIAVVDKMSAGLTYNDDFAVTVASASDYTDLVDGDAGYLAAAPEGYTIPFQKKFSADFVESHRDTDFVITYTATVNNNALVPTGRENEVTLVYDEGNYVLKDTVNYTTYFTGIEKVDGKNNTIKLKDVEFTLTENSNPYYVTKVGDYYVPIADPATDAMTEEEKAAARLAAQTVKTDASGKIIIRGLDNTKTYTLTETVTNEGYNLLDTPKDLSGSLLVEDKTDNPYATTTFDKILNYKGSTLPSTGGVGTTIFYVGGSILVIAAVILLVTKRRMSTHD